MLKPFRIMFNKWCLSLTAYKFLYIVQSPISHDFAI
jgi:hypothetical protein